MKTQKHLQEAIALLKNLIETQSFQVKKNILQL
jgi:hypothetical protein